MPHVIVSTQTRVETGPTFVGDEHSDPRLMSSLEAEKHQEFGSNFVVYRTKLAPRQVLDRLEEQGFRIVGTCGVGQTCVWTLSRNH